MSGAEWAGVAVDFILGLARLCLSAFVVYLLFQFMTRMAESITSKGNETPMKYMLRRMTCRHRKGFARVRAKYGNEITVCQRCGKDMTKRREEDRV